MRKRRSTGFTLIEMLTVIGILVILLAILLPVMATVRRKGFETDTHGQIQRLAAACQNYFNDFHAYPGPVPENLIVGNNTATGQTVTFTSATVPVTSSENLLLALSGGLKNNSGPDYDATFVGKGALSLNPVNPKQYTPYYDAAKGDISDNGAGTYQSNVAGLTLPEYMDHMPTPHVIIYVRANVGAPGVVDNVDSNNNALSPSQYYSAEMNMYWAGQNAGSCFPTKPDANNNNATLYNHATDFFVNKNLVNAPRSKDSFILISAGYDGIYGTSDDIVYSN